MLGCKHRHSSWAYLIDGDNRLGLHIKIKISEMCEKSFPLQELKLEIVETSVKKGLALST